MKDIDITVISDGLTAIEFNELRGVFRRTRPHGFRLKSLPAGITDVLNISDGDIVMVRGDVGYETLARISEGLRESGKTGVTVIAASAAIDISVLDIKIMAEAGWVRRVDG